MQLLMPDTANDKTEGWFEVDLSKINYEIQDIRLIIAYEQIEKGYKIEFLCSRLDDECVELFETVTLSCYYYELLYEVSRVMEKKLNTDSWKQSFTDMLKKHKRYEISFDTVGTVYSVGDKYGNKTLCISYPDRTDIIGWYNSHEYRVKEIIQGETDKLSILQHLKLL